MSEEIVKEVKEVVFTNHVVKKEFKESQVTEVKSSSTEIVNNYEVTIVNEQGETAVVELVQ